VSTLLQDLTTQKAARLEEERGRLLAALHRELGHLLPPGENVWVFGSLVQPGRFSEPSDIDLALERRPPAFSEFWLQGELELRLGRRVDILLLRETRLREKIEREGRRWTL
jgi:predicted nucleotidyltransferase